MISFLLNLPWTAVGLCMGLLSGLRRIELQRRPLAVVITVQSFWYLERLNAYRGIRAATVGNCIIMGPKVLSNDLEHELVHVQQANRIPFIHPILYAIENWRHPGKANKYEREAYIRSHSMYLD